MGCKNDFTDEATDFNPTRAFTDYPTYVCQPHTLTGFETIADDIMLNMLINQYQNSDNLKEYFRAFISQMDLVFEETKKVKLGRFIQNATGAQLDVIGEILQQSRSLYIPTIWFGFQGASPIAGMADEVTPSNGGVFKDEDLDGFTLTPLDDIRYRNVLLCRAYCINRNVHSVNSVYEAISILLGLTPNTMILTETQHKIWELQLDSLSVTSEQAQLIIAVKHWFIPMSVGFNVSLVNGLFDIQHGGLDITHNAVNVTHTA